MTRYELAEACIAKIRYTTQGAPAPLQNWLETFYEQIDALILTYLAQAQKSGNQAIVRELKRAGYHDAAEFVRGIQ